MPDDAEIRSLIKLLDDESEEIAATVRGRLLEIGIESLPYLEEASTNAPQLLRDRIRSITEDLAEEQGRKQFEELVQATQEDIDLEQSVLLIARSRYPNEDLRWCSETLDQLSYELDSKLDAHEDPLDIISTVAKFFSTEKGFRGDIEDYYNPENSYINRVLGKRSGLPISLCTIYLLVAKRLNIPLYGVGMPGHFLLTYRVGDKEIFLDPFRAGKMMSRTECRDFLEATGHGFREEYLATVTNRQIIERILRNLILAYRQRGEVHRVSSLQAFLAIVSGSTRS